MLSSQYLKFLVSSGRGRTCMRKQVHLMAGVCRNMSSAGPLDQKPVVENVEKLFLNSNVQAILKTITRFDPSVIFTTKPVESLKAARYLFMTEEELNVARGRASERGQKLLEMVPYMEQVNEEVQILDDTPELQGYETSNLVFTDISHGANDRNRLIVVRELNGILRRANREERHRMNQIYFPVEERQLSIPTMFEEKELEAVLHRRDYIFILERAATQFEPDDEQCTRVTRQTYDHVCETKSFDLLRSTRHYGAMVFHYCVNNQIDELLSDLIHKAMIEDSHLLVNLYYIIHKQKSSEYKSVSSQPLEAIQFYARNSSKKRHLIELSLQSYEEFKGAGDTAKEAAQAS